MKSRLRLWAAQRRGGAQSERERTGGVRAALAFNWTLNSRLLSRSHVIGCISIPMTRRAVADCWWLNNPVNTRCNEVSPLLAFKGLTPYLAFKVKRKSSEARDRQGGIIIQNELFKSKKIYFSIATSSREMDENLEFALFWNTDAFSNNAQ